jgi:hypothetical protein
MAGDNCDLTHESSPEVAPTCLHFLRGNCTKHPCPYSHASVNASAAICRSFAYLGYCEKGADCGERHLRECPDYNSATGCRIEHCPLPHVDRASQMRRKGANKTGTSDVMNVDDISSNDAASNGNETDDVDSEDIDEPEQIFGYHTHELSQQQDFIGLA